jgi:hypothetical protein
MIRQGAAPSGPCRAGRWAALEAACPPDQPCCLYQNPAARLRLSEDVGKGGIHGSDGHLVIQSASGYAIQSASGYAIRSAGRCAIQFWIQSATRAAEDRGSAGWTYRTDRGGDRPHHQLQCRTLDVGTDHAGGDRGRCVLGSRSRGNCSSMAADQETARRGSGHDHGLRIGDAVLGNRICLVAADTVAKCVPDQPGHSHRRSGLGTGGAEHCYGRYDASPLRPRGPHKALNRTRRGIVRCLARDRRPVPARGTHRLAWRWARRS